MALPPSLPPPQIQNAACRHDHRRARYFGGNIAYSHVRRRRHDRRSTRIETRHRQNALLVSTFATAASNPEYRVSSRSQTSQLFRAFTSSPAPPRSLFNSHRNAASANLYNVIGNKSNSAP
ncbi:hypothetical protein NP493_678g01014 [Ridgeia piscesae]|uniref:Uncharacterized protein n=1 Tax=Ridgeia piscesae TaxID=27915 RepID=A0AAD9KRT7_RIDPI|nr:hypothetical protein NP493_678g01014 [Ridgeia piscesae]